MFNQQNPEKNPGVLLINVNNTFINIYFVKVKREV